MRAPMPACVLLALSVFVALAGAHEVLPASVLVDWSSNSGYLSSTEGTIHLTGPGLTASVESLLGVKQSAVVDQSTAREVHSVVRGGDAFSRPSALVSISLAGVSDAQLSAFTQPDQKHHLLHLHSSPEGTVEALHSAAASMPDSGGSLEPLRLLDCDATCSEGFLRRAAAACGATYEAGLEPMSGGLTFPASSARLDLRRSPDQLWAMEAANLYGATERLSARRAATGEPASPCVVETTLMGMQSLGEAYGGASPEYGAAWTCLAGLIRQSQAELSASFEGRVVSQTTALGRVTSSGDTVRHLLQWDAQRRRLLQEGEPIREGATDSNDFNVTATAVGVGLVILYFVFGAISVLTRPM